MAFVVLCDILVRCLIILVVVYIVGAFSVYSTLITNNT